jgi:hypothetical protein
MLFLPTVDKRLHVESPGSSSLLKKGLFEVSQIQSDDNGRREPQHQWGKNVSNPPGCSVRGTLYIGRNLPWPFNSVRV